MDHCTETKKRSGQTGDWGKKNIYWDRRIRIATGIVPILKHTPSRILLTSNTTAHSILPCTKPGNKIPYPPLTSPPLGTPGNLIVIEDDDKELDGQSDDFYTAELTFSTPVSFLLHCQECTDWRHQYFECPQYICDHCYWQAPGHRVSDCLRRWNQWLQP